MKICTHSIEETERLGTAIGKCLKQGDVLALYGDIGLGKTTLTRGIAMGLGAKSMPSSPTFSLVHEHPTARGMLYHFDMYRIDEPEELYQTGFFDYLDQSCIIIVEWSEKIDYALPSNSIKIKLSNTNDYTSRIFEIEQSDTLTNFVQELKLQGIHPQEM